MKLTTLTALMVCLGAVTAAAQTPRPFPTPPRTGTTAPAPPQQPASPPQPVQPTTEQTPKADAPTEATLGLPIYPNAQFLTSYDAGRAQRYYLYGAQASFVEVVTYYKTYLKQKGELIFDQPGTHTFEVGRFRSETMAFPPGVTVKDFTFGGAEGYLNPKPGATPKYFPTIIQIVPVPAGAR